MYTNNIADQDANQLPSVSMELVSHRIIHWKNASICLCCEVIRDDKECTATVTDQSGATDIQSSWLLLQITLTIGAATISLQKCIAIRILCSPKITG